MKINNRLKQRLLNQRCIACGNRRSLWARFISADACLCDECLHKLQHSSRTACRQDDASRPETHPSLTR
ncbi:hypothetical protein HA48_16135 [Pantoea wallisii]|uniref:ClpX-type ZB domain-containing protein n=1 Tax=Pantoea wallisii TaxID=1076551 RepID=A0A1X1D3W2_9GAMM|nr:hypothetical protein HA48_16135 [Pantoea wallisii]